jgi:hypothetical protein
VIGDKTDVKIATTLPEPERRPYMRAIMANFPSDVEIADQKRLKRTGPKAKLEIIGASCGGGQARTEFVTDTYLGQHFNKSSA